MTKLASHVSDPQAITADDLTRVQRESEQLHLAFEAGTRGMEDVQHPGLIRAARRSLIIRRHRVMLQAELRAARMMPEDEDTLP